MSVAITLPGGAPAVANDVCDRCGEPVLVPDDAVRCEWGCCYFDVVCVPCAAHDDCRADPRLAVWCDRESGLARAVHECRLCRMETHRLPLRELVRMARAREPYFPPRGGAVRGSPEMKAAWEAYDDARRAWDAAR